MRPTCNLNSFTNRQQIQDMCNTKVWRDDFIASINLKNVFRPLVAVRICMRKLLGEKSDLPKTLSFRT